MHIYLIGFMGVGKTTIGKCLSRKLGLPFQDTDMLIEALTGLTVEEIFNTQGEAYFRQKEQEVIQNLAKGQSAVISTGGGLPCHFNNMLVLLHSGYVVYLNAKPAFLVSRLLASKKSRPLISGLNKDDLYTFVNERLSLREQYYLRANLIVDATAKSLNEVVKSVVLGYQHKLKKHGH